MPLSRKMRRVLAVGLLLLAMTSAGCTRLWGEGEGEIIGRLCNLTDPTDCQDNWNLDADFFALDRLGNRVMIYIRSAGGSLSRTNDLTIRILDVTQIDPTNLGPFLLDRDLNVQATLGLKYVHDPGHVDIQPLEGQASIEFQAFGAKVGDRIEATLDLPLVARADQTVDRGRLTGWFAFTMRNPPSENKDVWLPDDDEQIGTGDPR